MSQYSLPYRSFGRNINVKVDLSNYATKADLKEATGIDTSSFALKSNLASLKTEVDISDINKLVPIPVNLSKLSDIVKNDVVKKVVYNKLVTKVNSIDTTSFASKTKYNSNKSGLEKKISDAKKKIPNACGITKKTDLNAKITETVGEILSISGLATNSSLTGVENKIPDVSS